MCDRRPSASCENGVGGGKRRSRRFRAGAMRNFPGQNLVVSVGQTHRVAQPRFGAAGLLGSIYYCRPCPKTASFAQHSSSTCHVPTTAITLIFTYGKRFTVYFDLVRSVAGPCYRSPDVTTAVGVHPHLRRRDRLQTPWTWVKNTICTCASRT